MANKHGPASLMSPRQMVEFHAAVLRALPDLTAESAQGWIENPRGLAHVLREALMPSPAVENADTYKVTVDYCRGFHFMVADGKYDWVYERLNASRDKDAPADHIKLIGSGKHEVEIILLHLDRDATTTEVEVELDKRGLRPATVEELLALGAAYPQLQREFPSCRGSSRSAPSALGALSLGRKACR